MSKQILLTQNREKASYTVAVLQRLREKTMPDPLAANKTARKPTWSRGYAVPYSKCGVNNACA